MISKSFQLRRFSTAQSLSLLKYNYQTKQYQLQRGKFKDLDSICKEESASKILLIRNFPSLKTVESKDIAQDLFFLNKNSSVYGSDFTNALAAIKNDSETSQIFGVYSMESETSSLSENDQKTVKDLQQILQSLQVRDQLQIIFHKKNDPIIDIKLDEVVYCNI